MEGSFQCSCNEGFTLSASGDTCIDTDECTAILVIIEEHISKFSRQGLGGTCTDLDYGDASFVYRG